MAPKRNIVIVGGGGAGQRLSRALSAKLSASEYSLILIEPRPYHIHLPAALRMVVSDVDNLEKRILIPYDKNFINGNGSVIQGKVGSIHKSADGKGGHVILESGDQVPFEILVLATGSSWSGPIDFPDSPSDVSEFIAKGRERFRNAKKIVVVGGGVVGIELAGEVKDIWPDKEVTIVHNSDMLSNKVYPDKFRKALAASVHARGIKTILNDALDEMPEYDGKVRSLKTRNGQDIEADYVVSTRGGTPNTKYISSLGSDILSPSGCVKVKPTLQLASDAHADIFAIGDIVEWKEQKQLLKAQVHSDIVLKNILARLAGSSLADYKGSYEVCVVTNGKYAGSAYAGVLWGLVFPGWVVSMAKGKSIFIERTRGEHGY